MPFMEPIKIGTTLDTIRKMTRLAQLIIELRTEYERRPRAETLLQLKQRSAELFEFSQQLEIPEKVETPKEDSPPSLPQG